MLNEEKETILRQIYYDTEHGFGSIYETYKQAVKLLPSVTLNDVKEFLAKLQSRQLKAYRGFNSYVAHEPLQEIQIDLADFTKSAEATMGLGMPLWQSTCFPNICGQCPARIKGQMNLCEPSPKYWIKLVRRSRHITMTRGLGIPPSLLNCWMVVESNKLLLLLCHPL